MSSRNRSRRRNTLRRRAIGAGNTKKPMFQFAAVPAGVPAPVLQPRAQGVVYNNVQLDPAVVAQRNAQFRQEVRARGIPLLQLPRQGGRKSRHRSRRHRSRRHRSRGRK